MARHSGASFAVKLFSIGCAFLYAVIVARLLGPRGYGMVVIAIAVASIADTIALLGIDGLAVREAAAQVTRRAWPVLKAFIRWSSLTVLCTSLAAGLVIAFIAPFAQPYRNVLLLGALAVPLLAGLHLLKGLTLGSGHVVLAQLPLELVRWVVTLGLLAVLALQQRLASPETVMAVVLASFAIALAAAFGIFLRHVGSLPDDAAPPTARLWLQNSLPFLAVAVFGIVGTEISTLLLGALSGPREAGLYQPVARLSPLMLLANEAIDMALAPRIVRNWEEQAKAELARVVGRAAIASTGATLLIAGTILLAAPLILGAFGPDFTKYQSFLYWIAAAQVFNAALGASPLLLAMAGSMGAKLRAQAITLVVQAGLALTLIPFFGATGAVASLTVAIIVWALLHWWFALRETGIDTSIFSAFRRERGCDA